jgi:hypothetical protein
MKAETEGKHRQKAETEGKHRQKAETEGKHRETGRRGSKTVIESQKELYVSRQRQTVRKKKCLHSISKLADRDRQKGFQTEDDKEAFRQIQAKGRP